MTAGPDDPEVERELRAAIAARSELGAELEPQVIDSFVERIERRLEERGRERAPAPRATRHSGEEFVLTIVSLGVAIPMLGIAGGIAGFPGIVVVCLALVLVNLIFRR